MTEARAHWKRLYRQVRVGRRRSFHHSVQNSPRILTHFWRNGKRVPLKEMAVGCFTTRMIDCREKAPNVLLMDVELVE